MLERMVRAIKLDVSLYEEVENDKSATLQAAGIVVLVAVITGLALAGGGPLAILWGIVFGLLGWAAWASLTYFVGAVLLPQPQTHANWGQMARGLGFVQSVLVLRFLGLIPVIGGILLLVITLWQIAAMVIAVRQSLDYTSTLRAVGVVIIGAIPYVILLFFLADTGAE